MVCWAWEPQPCGARRRAGICGVAAPRRYHHIACVAAPCICLPGARAKMPTYSCANPKPKILCKLPGIFLRGLLGAHASCVEDVRHLGTLEACAPRHDLCVSAVRFGVQALA